MVSIYDVRTFPNYTTNFDKLDGVYNIDTSSIDNWSDFNCYQLGCKTWIISDTFGGARDIIHASSKGIYDKTLIVNPEYDSTSYDNLF